jgi:guanylate kinase
MNELTQIDAFKKVLADYHLSDEAKATLAATELALLVGPTSAGRNTIINELLKSGHYHQIVSDTTRQPRSNNGVMEQNGVEYWFRSEDEILADLEAGAFLEAAIIHEQQVSGISIRELEAAANEGKIAINEIEVVGADNIHAAKPDTMFFFVLPPSFDEWMARMSGRGTLPEDEVRRRLESAVKEITIALERDYYCFMVNDTFVQTAHKIDAVVTTKANDSVDQEHGRTVAQQLLADTKAHLAS